MVTSVPGSAQSTQRRSLIFLDLIKYTWEVYIAMKFYDREKELNIITKANRTAVIGRRRRGQAHNKILYLYFSPV
jgi:hypothetical protein